MKTQNNNQETSKGQVSRTTLRSGSVILSAVLISLSVSGQELWKEFSNSATYGKMALMMDGQISETENTDAAFNAINAEVTSQLYNANESFVAETEEPMEVESWMTEVNFYQDAEEFTANTTNIEIAKYAEKTIDAVELEEALTIENWMTEETFFTEAEQYTANSADIEIAQYAEMMIDATETEEALEVESWMIDESLFTEAEQYTANGADQEIEIYADKVITTLGQEDALTIESWMLDTENFSSQLFYDRFAIR